MPKELEYCCECDNPTGRAGKGEDSLYTDGVELGPYCEDCWSNTEFWRNWTDALLVEFRRLSLIGRNP